MSEQNNNTSLKNKLGQTQRVFQRFTTSQRWEHWLLFLSFTVLFLTGIPQKYRTATWSQQILSTPEQLYLIQTIHHIAAVVLILEVIYHLGMAVYRMSKRNLSSDIFVSTQDIRDAGHMLAYLLFIKKDKPKAGKYSFEEKITYWFIFIGVGIMVGTGLVLWFPIFITKFLPGSIIPASKMAHSTEAVVAAIFIVIWHFFHVHLQRLNLSIFNGQISEQDMKAYHQREYESLTGEKVEPAGEKSQ